MHCGRFSDDARAIGTNDRRRGRQQRRSCVTSLLARLAGSTPAASAEALLVTWPLIDGTPHSGTLAAGADPPVSLLPRLARSACGWANPPNRALSCVTSLRPLLRDARKQRTNLGLPVPAVTPERTDGCQLASLRPPRDGLGIHPEHGRDLRRREQRL